MKNLLLGVILTVVVILGCGSVLEESDMAQMRTRAYLNTSSQLISAATETKIAFNAETFDTGSHFSTSTYKLTADETTYALVHCNINASPTLAAVNWASGDYITLRIKKNGTVVAAHQFYIGYVGDSNAVDVSISDYVNMVSTDYVEIYILANSGCIITYGSTISYFYAAQVK